MEDAAAAAAGAMTPSSGSDGQETAAVFPGSGTGWTNTSSIITEQEIPVPF